MNLIVVFLFLYFKIFKVQKQKNKQLTKNLHPKKICQLCGEPMRVTIFNNWKLSLHFSQSLAYHQRKAKCQNIFRSVLPTFYLLLTFCLIFVNKLPNMTHTSNTVKERNWGAQSMSISHVVPVRLASLL